MTERITSADLKLINGLSSRSYHGNRLLSNATEEEKIHLDGIKAKLKRLAEYFADRYGSSYGPFGVSVTTGNPIAIGGRRLNRIWSGIYKGNSNKQYAAQVSFVMNPSEECLDLGFYFGRVSGRRLQNDERTQLENQLILNGNHYRLNCKSLYFNIYITTLKIGY